MAAHNNHGDNQVNANNGDNSGAGPFGMGGSPGVRVGEVAEGNPTVLGPHFS